MLWLVLVLQTTPVQRSGVSIHVIVEDFRISLLPLISFQDNSLG